MSQIYIKEDKKAECQRSGLCQNVSTNPVVEEEVRESTPLQCIKLCQFKTKSLSRKVGLWRTVRTTEKFYMYIIASENYNILQDAQNFYVS